MSNAMATPSTGSWKWVVCIVLLAASAINYMDRQTLANASVRITKEFSLTETQYGNVEAVFAYAFAVGSIVFGWLADRVSVKWLYAIVLGCWSIAGFSTGFADGYPDLLVCRFLLGFFEAGHWPCGVKTTRALLAAEERSLGNSLLQSGTSIGAIFTPLIMMRLMTPEVGSWRFAFQLIGGVGAVWIVAWFAILRHRQVQPTNQLERTAADESETSIWSILMSRRMLVLYVVIACINTTFQLYRAWLPKFLQTGRGYAEGESLLFNSVWYAATDVGCIGAGAVVLWCVRRGMDNHRARIFAFSGCAILCAASLAIPYLPAGPALLAVLLVIGAGALGMFPIYHALTQDISGRHQGRITGIAGVAAWIVPAQAQTAFGYWKDSTGSYDQGMAVAGLLPLIAAVAIAVFWQHGKEKTA